MAQGTNSKIHSQFREIAVLLVYQENPSTHQMSREKTINHTTALRFLHKKMHPYKIQFLQDLTDYDSDF